MKKAIAHNTNAYNASRLVDSNIAGGLANGSGHKEILYKGVKTQCNAYECERRGEASLVGKPTIRAKLRGAMHNK